MSKRAATDAILGPAPDAVAASAAASGAAPPAKKKKLKKEAGADGSSGLSGLSAVGIEKKLVALLGSNPKGLSHEEVCAGLKCMPSEMVDVINNLLNKHRIELLQDGSGTVFYKLVSLDKVEKLRGLSPADMLVYQLIEKSSNLGIWIKDLRRKSNLSALEIPKILKELLKRRLIKCEKSVAATNKKVYMLYEIEPAREVSGGAWYDKATGEFDREYMAALETTVMHFLERKSKQRDAERERAAAKIGYAGAAAAASSSAAAASPALESGFASPADVERYLKETGAFKTVPSADETNKILAGLVYEGRVERKEDEQGDWDREEAAENAAAAASSAGDEDRPLAAARRRRRDDVSYVYRYVRAGVFASSFAQIPCATCPVAKNCFDGNPISPQSCEYLAQWLQF